MTDVEVPLVGPAAAVPAPGLVAWTGLTDEAIVGLADAVVAVLGVEDDPAVRLRARAQVQVMARMVRAYTRGRGFDAAGLPGEDVASVIISATSRWASNPAMSDSESSTGPVLKAGPGGQPLAAGTEPVLTESFAFSGFQGFTELERRVLHGHRVRNG